MKEKQWYEALFENYGKSYDKESYTHGTVGECDFIEKDIGYDRKLKILDVGCGTGRHAIELAKRGYSVKGIDLSESQLERAREKAKESNLDIEFAQCDARDLPFEDEYDVVIMLCEGAFPLMETDEMNFAILQGIAKALKAKGKVIFTTLNGLFPLYHSIEEFLSEYNTDETTQIGKHFDIMTMRDYNEVVVTDDDGNKKTLDCNERYYMPSEITWLLKTLGFKTIDIFAAELGKFSRNDKLKTDDFEMLVIAQR